MQSAFLGYVESVIASLNFRETEFDEFIELVSFYVINRLRHYREEPVADVTPQWLKNTVEAMHDKLKFGEGALEKHGSLIRKNAGIFNPGDPALLW
ncbi:DNA-binding transcriptional regulator ChbR [Klebsiella pneumoniae]|uniref:DNA-binding transcriptional regulator ChbR n=1 Tax=Klebsiella pneumoniae TaxID=573 RepID=A0A378BEM2_KLEPN|nr:DNA-binding transcriptional regulator ChbR [Klebsiella pneumoniae]